MQRFKDFLRSNWTASIVVGLCVLFLSEADAWFPRLGRMFEILDTSSPLLDTILTWMAVVALSFFGVQLIRSLFRWAKSKRDALYEKHLAAQARAEDIANDGPRRRKLKALAVEIGKAKRDLIAFADEPFFVGNEFSRLATLTRLKDDMWVLCNKLAELNIGAPRNYTFNTLEEQRRIVVFLTELEAIAERGDIALAEEAGAIAVIQSQD